MVVVVTVVERGSSDSCFPSALQSTAVSQSQNPAQRIRGGAEHQSGALKEMRGPKYLQLEGHPNLFSHIHGAHQASRAFAWPVL